MQLPPDFPPPGTTKQLSVWTLPPGTLILIDGLPYWTVEPTKAEGYQEPREPQKPIPGCFQSSDVKPPSP